MRPAWGPTWNSMLAGISSGNFSQTGLRQRAKHWRICVISGCSLQGAVSATDPSRGSKPPRPPSNWRWLALSVITAGHTCRQESPGRQRPAEVLTGPGPLRQPRGPAFWRRRPANNGCRTGRNSSRTSLGIIGADLDPGNLAANGHSSSKYRIARPRILHVHATDGVCDPGKRRGERVELGSGVADFPALLGALEEVGYQGYYTIQPAAGGDAQAEAARAIEFLRKF